MLKLLFTRKIDVRIDIDFIEADLTMQKLERKKYDYCISRKGKTHNATVQNVSLNDLINGFKNDLIK
jgi:hypothetical protein